MRLDREGEETRREAGAQALALPVLGGGTRVIETIRWDLAQARHVEDSRAAGHPAGRRARRPRARRRRSRCRPRRCGCWRASTCRRCCSRWATSPTPIRRSARRPTTAARHAGAGGLRRGEPVRAGAARRRGPRLRAAMKRTVALRARRVHGAGAAGVGRERRPPVPGPHLVARCPGGAEPPPPAPTARITATLFYGAPRRPARSQPVRVDVPLAEGAVAQGRQIVPRAAAAASGAVSSR